MRKIPLPVEKVAIQKGRWLNASARKGKTPGSNRGRRSETAICIYGLKEEIRARKSPETVDAPGSSPDASTVSLIWYARLDSNQRPLESELSGRQAGKPCRARAWLRLHKFPPFCRKTSEALSDRASGGFRDSSLDKMRVQQPSSAEYLYPLSLDQISGIASKYFGKVKHNTGLRFCKFVLLLFVELDHSQGDSGCFTELLLCQPSRLPCKL